MEDALLAGDTLDIWVNQGMREANVLARIGNKILVEYEMPAGSTALLFLIDGEPDKRVNVTYRGLALKWLQAIRDQGQDWIGNPQGYKRNRPGTVDQELARRESM